MPPFNFKFSIDTYIGNLCALLLAGIGYIDTIDIGIKLISLAIAGVVLYFTVRRMKREIQVRNLEIEIFLLKKQQEEHNLHLLMEKSKKIGMTSNGTKESKDEKVPD